MGGPLGALVTFAIDDAFQISADGVDRVAPTRSRTPARAGIVAYGTARATSCGTWCTTTATRRSAASLPVPRCRRSRNSTS